MKNKRKKNKRRLILFFSILCVFTFLFKNKTIVLKAKKENFKPVIKITDGIFVNEEAKLMKIEEDLNLPLIKGNIQTVFNKKIASLYPCVEIIKIISKNYPEFLDSIESIEIENYEIIFRNKKSVVLGLGNYEEKLKFLFENYQNLKKRSDLKILSFKKRRF